MQEEDLRRMEMTRRRFCLMILSVAALCAVGVRWLAIHSVPQRFVKALKPRSFPGLLRPLDAEEVRKQGKWAG